MINYTTGQRQAISDLCCKIIAAEMLVNDALELFVYRPRKNIPTDRDSLYKWMYDDYESCYSYLYAIGELLHTASAEVDAL